MVFLTAKRISLRNLIPGDIDEIYAYRNDPACARYQRWDAFSKEEIERYIREYTCDAFLSEKGEQHFAVCNEKDGKLIGELSYFYAKDDCITLGITISHRHQRKGYAKEILTAVIMAIRAKYPTLEIVALIERGNDASMALFKKLGFFEECYAESISSYVYVLKGDLNGIQ